MPMHDLRFMLFPRAARTLHQMALSLGIISFSSLIIADYSRSDDKCEFADVLRDRFVWPENRGGEFRILLNPPNYDDPRSVQDHLVFSATLARRLTSELRAQTDDQCDAFIDSLQFPDLHVYLIVNQRSRDASEDRLRCIRALQSALLDSEPDDQSIRKSASEEAQSRLHVISNPGGHLSNAATILQAALPLIYESNSLLHAIYSVAPKLFQSLDASAFRVWLRGQRSSERIGLRAMSLCRPGLDPRDPQVNSPPYKFPYSNIIPPGVVKLSAKGSERALARYLQHVVIVGHGAILNAPDLPPVTAVRAKYCRREHVVLPSDRDVSLGIPATVRIRCLTSARERDSWTVLFCDPQDCTSEYQAQAVVTAIANDPDVEALARSNAENGQPRGPYLIDVETTGE